MCSIAIFCFPANSKHFASSKCASQRKRYSILVGEGGGGEERGGEGRGGEGRGGEGRGGEGRGGERGGEGSGGYTPLHTHYLTHTLPYTPPLFLLHVVCQLGEWLGESVSEVVLEEG